MSDSNQTLPILNPTGTDGNLFIFLQDFASKVSDKLANPDSDLVAGLVSGLLVLVIFAIASSLLLRTWHLVKRLFWQLASKLSTVRGLRALALKAYLREVKNYYGKVTNIYLDKEETLDLHRVFVPLTLRSVEGRLQQARSAREILTDPKQTRLIILGNPGSGKTTLLKALASGVSRRQWVEFDQLMPVFVPLRTYAMQSNPQSIMHYLCNDLLPARQLIKGEAILTSQLKQGRCLLMFDGLDEISERDIDRVTDALTDFLNEYDPERKNRIFITCREQNYDLLPDPGVFQRLHFDEYHLSDLRDSEMETMVFARQTDFARHKKSPEKFLRTVHTHRHIQHYHRNPLILTLSIGLYLNRLDDTIPHNLADFYHESIDHLLRRHDFRSDAKGSSENREKSKANQFEARDKHDLLNQFALQQMLQADAQQTDFETFAIADLIDKAGELARNRLSIQTDQAEPLVDEIHRNAGLISHIANREYYAFAHRSLHEYCAAQQLKQNAEAGINTLLGFINHKDWRQVLIFYCSMDHDNAQKVIHALLADTDNPTQQLARQTLAAQCTAVLARPLIDLRKEVASHLDQTLRQADSVNQQRQLLSSLLHLRHDAPKELAEPLDTYLQAFIQQQDAVQFAQEISRTDEQSAIALLGFMAKSKETKNQQATLVALQNIETIDKLELLWMLLAQCYRRDDLQHAKLAQRQIMQLVPHEQTLDRLRRLPQHFIEQIGSDIKLDEDVLNQVYPFREQHSNDNFVDLLLLEKINPSAAKISDTSWREFVNSILQTKNHKPQKQWQALPKLLEKSRWWQTKTWRLSIHNLGHLSVLGTLIVSWHLFYIMLVESGLLHWGWIESIIVIPILIGISSLFMIFVMSLLWRLFRFGLKLFDLLLGLELFGLLQLDEKNKPAIVQGIWSLYYQRYLARVPLIFFLPFSSLWVLGLFITQPVLYGHASDINSIAFSPDGQYIATGSRDSTAKIWHSQTGDLVQTLLGHRDNVISVALSPDGQYIATGSWDNTAKTWDRQTGDLVRTFSVHKEEVISVAFSPDGQYIATGSVDNTAKIWNSQTGDLIHTFSGHKSNITSVAFSHDGQYLAISSWDNTANIWDRQTGDLVRTLSGHKSYAANVTFSPDGQYLATGSWDGTAKIWNSQTGDLIHTFSGHKSNITSVAFSPDGRYLATSLWDNTAKIWHSQTGDLVQTFSGHKNTVTSVAFSPDGQYIATGSWDDTAKVWGVDNGKLLWTTPLPFYSDSTWNWYDLLAFLLLYILVIVLPSTKWFNPGRYITLYSPNPYLIKLKDIPNVERWIPEKYHAGLRR